MEIELSACLIVRDEAEHLADCLASLRGAVDEVVVVDTGSRDASVEIARDAGARVETFAWIDDFAAARNFAAGHARGRWILSVDADERLDASSRRAIRHAVITAPDDVFAFELRQVTYTDERALLNWHPIAPSMRPWSRGRAGFIAMTMQRLYRNASGVRFEGRVHELVGPSVSRMGRRIERCPADLHHYGRLEPNALVAKLRSYVALGERKLRDDPTCPRTYLELGTQLGELGEPERAIEILERGVARCERAPGLLLPLAGYLVGRGDAEDARAEALCRRRLDVVPDCAASLAILGNVALRRDAPHEALARFDAALSIQPELLVARRGRLAALAAAGHLSSARACADTLLETAGDDVALLVLAGKLDVALERHRDAVEILERARRLGAGGVEIHELLAVALERCGERDRARAHLRRAARARAALAS